jgi:hypothetical protein
MLLTRTELDFLLGKRVFTRDQAYYIKSRLLKKVNVLLGTELPLLQSADLVKEDDLAACSKDLAAGCKVWRDSLVRIPPPFPMGNENERGRKEEENGGPGEIRTPDPRHVKAVS